MASIYALDSVVDTFKGVRVGRLVFRYATAERVPGRPTFRSQHEDWRLIEPHRRYWLARKMPMLVRVQYRPNTFSYYVFHWRKGRVSWSDAVPLVPAGSVLNGDLLLEKKRNARGVLLQPSQEGVLGSGRRRTEQGVGDPAQLPLVFGERAAEGERGRKAARHS